ncbi:MAG TPA: serine hydrolase [Mycobacteriales bacterium]
MAGDERQAAIRRIAHRKHTALRPVSLVVAVVLLLAAACSSSGAPTSAGPAVQSSAAGSGKVVVPPDTPAGAQLGWLIAATAHLPLSDAEVRAHFNPGFLAMVSPATLNQSLQPGRVRLVSVKVSEPTMIIAVVSAGGEGRQDRVTLVVDSRGLISGLDSGPVIPEPVPTTWAGVDAALRSVAPQIRLLVANVTDGSCRSVHSIDPATPAPIGSVLKLYVLTALSTAVAAGTVRWDQTLAITAQVKSPGSVLQYEPDGTQISVRDTATKMISISDNTASDMLINLVGRSAVEAALTTAGMANPALDRPALTSRETFILELQQWPTLAQRYLATNEAGRRALLADTIDRLPLPDAATMRALGTHTTAPGWVASASDLCRAYTKLAALTRRPGLSPIGQALSLNDLGLELDPAQWRTTWFKGGTAPGAGALTYLATTRTGQSYVVTVLVRNPSPPKDDRGRVNAILLSAIKAAFTLAAHG